MLIELNCDDHAPRRTISRTGPDIKSVLPNLHRYVTIPVYL